MKFLYLRTVFWFDLKSGGSVGHTSGVINSLSKHTNVDVISNDKLFGVNSGITIISPFILKQIPFRLGEIFYNFIIIKKIKKIIKNYDYIYHRYSGLTFSAAFLSKKYNIPLILEFNASDVWMLKHWSKQSFWAASLMARIVNFFKLPIVRYIEKYNLNKAELIVVPSRALKETLIKKGIPEVNILENPNGVDQRIYSPSVKDDEIRNKYNLDNYFIIGFIGTFAQWHGVVEMAKSIDFFFKLNPNYFENIKFLLIGDGRLMPSVRNVIKKSRCKDNVIFAGSIPQNEGPKYLSQCDVLLSPHIKNPDGSKFFGSPTKIFEYMAMGKPIIASDIDQISEIFEHGHNALLVEPGNIKQLAYAMQKLHNDTQLRKKLGQNARSNVMENYTWEKHVEKILLNISTKRFG